MLSAELDAALHAGDNETAQELMTLMELEHQHGKLEDEELALQIMEEELRMLELSEQMQALQLHAGVGLANPERAGGDPNFLCHESFREGGC